MTDLCKTILKNVLNHTRNIQSKDFERLPYPLWVNEENRNKVIILVKDMISTVKEGCHIDFKSITIDELNYLFAWQDIQITKMQYNTVHQLLLL